MRFHQLFESVMPLRSFGVLWHVGTMDVADKHTNSMEGAGLSVSLHPDDWASIARIGGPVWRLNKHNNRFIDFLAMNEAQQQHVITWGDRNGLLERGDKWRVSYYDSEVEDTRYYYVNSQEEAEAERPWMEDEDYEGFEITHMPGQLKPTIKLLQLSKQTRPDILPEHALELTTILYAERNRLDGVWFNETHDPDNLSAPRGVIVPSMVKTWRAVREDR